MRAKPYRRTPARISAFLAACYAGILAAHAQQALPGGATSLNETHGDWTVACVVQDNNKRCTLSQQQVDAQSRQRMLAIELGASSDGKAQGALMLPFGLALEKGVVLRVDDGEPLPSLAFRTCLPAGCVVPVSFDTATIASLRKGKQLQLEAVADGGKPISFSISLAGLGGALDRLAELGKS
ncbi:MAG TPA: invasion associated locus B family protein [Rhizobiaceae bacterium]|nr:invasion associated locus B family protein [Rhizobiaceae bacterium]